MDTKQLLESFKHSLQQEINEVVSKDNYLDYQSLLVGNLKRIYYIDKVLQDMYKE